MKQILILTAVLLAGCDMPPDEPVFWYPKALKQVNCGGFSGEVYQMTHTRGWRSWPYYLDPSDMREVELGADCTMKIIKKFPTYKYRERPIRPKLTEEQRKYIVDGNV